MTEFEYKLELAKKAVTKGKLSRRDFTKFALAGGLSLTVADSLFIRAARAEAKKGGHFRVGLGHGATTDTFDPATWAHGMNFAWGKGLTGAPLVRIDQKGGVVPYLADSFEPSDGAKKWVFKIKKGVKFGSEYRRIIPPERLPTEPFRIVDVAFRGDHVDDVRGRRRVDDHPQARHDPDQGVSLAEEGVEGAKLERQSQEGGRQFGGVENRTADRQDAESGDVERQEQDGAQSVSDELSGDQVRKAEAGNACRYEQDE